MNNKLFSFIRLLFKPFEKDVFKSTQTRLTRNFTGLLILFLSLFIAIVCTVLYVFILNNQERELQTLVKQEATFIQNYLLKNEHSDLHGISDQEVVFAGVNQYFYYVVNPNGEVLMGNEANPRLRSNLLGMVNGTVQKDGEVRRETLQLDEKSKGRGSKGEFRPQNAAKDMHIMVASQSIYDNGQFIGQLYIGKDVSFTYQLFHWILVILLVLGILFVGVALFISMGMSKRAMVPISAAFTRQREFVGDASHELRTPLSVLLSSVDAMEITIDTDKEEMAGKLLSNMREEVKRMTNLVSDLLTLARSDSNTIDLRMETFDLRPLAEKTIESVKPLAVMKQISLELHAPVVLQAAGDPQRLAQLLYILLDNAIKYTPAGGEVKLYLSNEAHELKMVVQDTGIGIRKEDYHRIFERFYRADKSRSRQMGGHGLGLSIAKWIVETHKGTIKVASEMGQGSQFIVKLPTI